MTESTPPRPTDACAHPARELLDFHLNGTLPPGESAMVRRHLDECARCLAELHALASVTGAIARYGIDPAPVVHRPWRRWRLHGLAAALVLLAALGLLLARRRGDSPPARLADAATVEASLDLGRGAVRGDSQPPTLPVTPALRRLRVTLSPPVQPGARYLAGLECDGIAIAAEAPLGPLDPVGRGEVVFPAERLPSAGACTVVLRVVTAGGEARTFPYPFVVVRSLDPP